MFNATTKKKNQQRLIGPILTTEPIEVPPVNQTATPIWIRLPKSGKSCPFTGLSRSTLNNLILGKNPQVKSVSLRQHHAIRGCRIILLQSLLEFIEGMAKAQSSTHSAAANAVVERVDNKTNPAVNADGKAETRRAAKSKPRATRTQQ